VARRSEQSANDPALGSFDPLHHPPKPFGDADWQWFSARCAALGISSPLPRRATLEALYGHLVGVNRWLNLTTLTSPREYLKNHVLDSLTIESDSRMRHLSEGSPCIDLGSGGGYPGLTLSLWHEKVAWVLCDARRKKAEFLAAAARLAGTRVSARHVNGAKCEHEAPELFLSCQLVVSRAMGAMSTVLSESVPFLQKSGHVVLYVGPTVTAESRLEANRTAGHLGLRLVHERKVRLEDADPERFLVIYKRVGPGG